jgi:DNA polymerase III epsilon subunit-like protein
MYVFLDTETTGFARDGVQPRIVSLAWIIAEGAATPQVSRNCIVRPDGFTIPAAAAAVHGITTERARATGRPVRSVLDDFADDIRRLKPHTVVAHNLAYDFPIVAAEFRGLGIGNPCEGLTWSCTMLLARGRWPGESAKLGDVYRRVFRKPLAGAHDAGADVLACARVFFHLQTTASARKLKTAKA